MKVPSHASLQDLGKEARKLLHDLRHGHASALEHYHSLDPLAGAYQARLADAQYIIARKYGFASWQLLKRRIENRYYERKLTG